MPIGDVIDNWEFDSTFCERPVIIHISGNVYAVVYSGGWPGRIKTGTITPTGAISATGESLQYDTYGRRPDIIHISGTIYAVTYQGPSLDGWIRTFNITSAGVITATGYSHEFDAAYCASSSLVHVSGDVYAIAYTGPTGNEEGIVKTVTINAITGEIAATGHSVQFDAVGYYPHIIPVAGTIYVVVYYGPLHHGLAKTVDITAEGVPTLTGHSLDFDDFCTEPQILHISGDVYAIAYEGGVKTITINEFTGAIALTGYSLEIAGEVLAIVKVSGTTYAIAYTDPDGDGQLITFSIETDGTLGAITDTVEFNTEDAHYSSLLMVSMIYAVAYTAPSSYGRVTTIGQVGAAGGLPVIGIAEMLLG